MKHLHQLTLCVFSFMFVISSLLIYPLAVFAQESMPLKPNPIAEQWVLEQIAAGRIADLALQFPNEEDRVLSAVFLEKLLDKPSINMTRYGVRIKNATFVDALDFEYLELDYELWLNDCIFEGYVDLYESRFTHNLSFDGTTFSSGVDFHKIRVDKALYIGNVNFKESANFRYSSIGGNLVADSAKFSSTELEADFNSMKVDGTVFLNEAVFAGPADFAHTEIGNSFDADDAQFTSKEQIVNFNTMRVEKYVFLRKAVFAGPVNFVLARIGINLEADEAQFNNTEQEADFNSMKVDGSVFLNEAMFAGPADFAHTEIGNSFDADDAQFTSKEQIVNFNTMRVEKYVFLRKAVFAGPVNFVLVQIGINLEADDAQFNSTEQEADFNSMKVDGSVFLRRASFMGPVDFGFVEAKINFEANDTRVEGKANFNSMKIGGYAFFGHAVFAGPVDFRYSEFWYFQANGAEFQSTESEPLFDNMIVKSEAWFSGTVFKSGVEFDDALFLDLTVSGGDNNNMISNLALRRTVVQRELRLESLEIQDFFSESLVVYGYANISDVHIVSSANFENSQFGDLSVENVNWPADLENISLGGMSYQNIQIILESNADAWEELIGLVNRSKYNAQTYTTLENYFLQQGYPERADNVYVAYKRRERAEALSWNSIGWWWSLFLDLFVLYGRSPGRALGWSILFIIIGCLVFRKSEGMVSLSKREILSPKVGNRGMLSRKVPMRIIPAHQETAYNPIWYSLDLFIPFVDLGFDNKWSPRSDRKWAGAYAKIHMLAGWILIPIGLLALTGVIK